MGVQEIYDKLRTAPQHRASSVELFDEMTLQAGDVVTVSSDGQNYSVPIYSQDIHWTGAGMTVLENTGNEKREPLPAQKRRDFATNKRGYGNSKRQDGTDKWIEDFENTDLWVNQDTIWAVSGAYQVWTDPVSGVKHIQLKDGALLEVDRGDGVYSTVGTSYGITQVNNEVVNVIEGSALWTQRNNITGVCGEFTVITDSQTGKKRLKIANGTGLVMTRDNAEFGVYDDGTLTAGVIATKVNGVTSTKISGANIMIGDENANVTISGMKTRISNLETDTLKTENLYAAIGNLTEVNVQTLSFASASSERGGISVASVNTATLSIGGTQVPLTFIKSASVSGNVLTLSPFVGNDITFSKATSLSGEWGSGHLQVTAEQAGVTVTTYDQYLVDSGTKQNSDGTAYTDGNTWYVPVNVKNSAYDQSSSATGCRVAVDATTRYNAGVTYGKSQGRPSSGTAGGRTSGVSSLVHDFTITCVDSVTKTLQIDVSSIYTTARSGYTYGTFSKAALTVQASSSVLCYREISGTGTYYYTAGTTITGLRNAGSGTKYDRGTKGGSVRPNNLVRFKRHSSSETPSGTWYSIVSSGGDLSYYTYVSGDWYPGNGGSFTPQGTAYGDITPIGSTSLRLTATYLYPAGTTYNTSNSPYYTKA